MIRIVLFIVALTGLSFATWTLVLWGFSRLFRAQKATLGRAALVYGLMGLSSLMLGALCFLPLLLSRDSPSAASSFCAVAAVMAGAPPREYQGTTEKSTRWPAASAGERGIRRAPRQRLLLCWPPGIQRR